MLRKLSDTADWNRYSDYSLIAKGGMGVLYKSRDPSLDRWVALKFLRLEYQSRTDQLLREAQLQSRVASEHVCNVYEVGSMQGLMYLAMQFVSGPTLLQASRSLSIWQMAEVARQIALTAHAVHECGFVHGDIKPSNILVTEKHHHLFAYLIDFGVASEIGVRRGVGCPSGLVGTPPYMAPEQAFPEIGGVDPRTDVFSIGATLYFLLSGSHPRRTPTRSYLEYFRQLPRDLNDVSEGVPNELGALVMRCLQPEPARRFPHALAVAASLADQIARASDSSGTATCPIAARRHTAMQAC